MAHQNNQRLYVLIALTIITGIIFILALIPNSPFVSANGCMDNETAAKMYASKDLTTKTKYIEKRNSQCLEMLKYAQEPKDTYERLDICNMVDSVVDASKHYIEIHKTEKSVVNKELRELSQNVQKYNYCPQYEDVVTYLNETAKNYR